MNGPAATSYARVAEAVADTAGQPLPPRVDAAARRTLFNVLATALGASASPEVTALASVLTTATGTPVAPGVPGRAPAADAALVTGFAAHVDDFDDTHLATVIHPGAAVLGATWAAAWSADVPGTDVLKAFALGCELQLRLGTAVTPEHYGRGWHITGTCGALGAAATAGLLYGLDRSRLVTALTLATLRTVGHREGFGTAVKPFHAGKAATNAIVAVETAMSWKTSASSPRSLCDVGHLLESLAPERHSPEALLDGFGSRWELEANTFKPYPCGIVAHPGIDAAIDAYRSGVSPSDIVAVRYLCHPLVPELMGNPSPVTGLQARFSAVHGVAAGLVHGAAGLSQFSDRAAADPTVSAVRRVVELRPDDRVERDAAVLDITDVRGSTTTWTVPHARGSLPRPLTDDELVAKAEALVPGRAHGIWQSVSSLSTNTGPTSLQALVAPASPEVARV